MTDERVEVCLPKTDDDVLISDGDTRLYLVREMYDDEIFGFGMQDMGGFSSMFVTKESWEEMKRKVDAFILERDQRKQ